MGLVRDLLRSITHAPGVGVRLKRELVCESRHG
jgi:hypothetical protein